MDLAGLRGDVEALLREVSERHIRPAFRALAPEQVRAKRGGEIVTDVDLAVERALAPALRGMVAGSTVVGEESAAGEPFDFAAQPWSWLVDPIDGTEHFARGEDTFGVMVALLERGATAAGWIYEPALDRMTAAVRGAGASIDGTPIALDPAVGMAEARGAVLARYLPAPLRARVEVGASRLRPGLDHRCGARRYADIAAGREHFVLYYRTRPWDHAAGALIVEEAGGRARRYDGAPYRPGGDVPGLLAASNPALWDALVAELGLA